MMALRPTALMAILIVALPGPGLSSEVDDLLTKGKSAFDRGSFSEALEAFQAAGAARLAATDRQRVLVLNGEATTLHKLGRLKEAKSRFEVGVAEARRTLSPGDPLIGTLLDNRGQLRSDLGDQEGALEDIEEARRIRQAGLAPGDRKLLTSRINLAAQKLELGRLEEARRAYQALVDELAPQGASEELAIAWNGLGEVGRLQRTKESVEAALGHYRRAAAIWVELGGPEHRERAIPLNNLGVALGLLGRHGEAAEVQLESLAIKRKNLGDAHPSLAASYHNLGNTLLDTGDPVGAVDLFERALKIVETTKGPGHLHAGLSGRQLALALAATGRPEEARIRHEQAIEVLRKYKTPGETLADQDLFREALKKAPTKPLPLAKPALSSGSSSPPGEEAAPEKSAPEIPATGENSPHPSGPAVTEESRARPQGSTGQERSQSRESRLRAALARARRSSRKGHSRAAYELSRKILRAAAKDPPLPRIEARAALLAGQLALSSGDSRRARALLKRSLERSRGEPRDSALATEARRLLKKTSRR